MNGFDDESRTYDWTQIEIGTPIKIVGERGQFVFRKVDHNGDIECHGGSNGRAMIRTFTAERVKIRGKRRTKRIQS